MQNVRLPLSIELKEGVLLGDNSTNVTLWRKGQEPKAWDRIRSSMSPEGIELSDDAMGVKVTVSQWKERVRSFLKKLFGGKSDVDVLTDEVPLGGGKSIEVEQAERGGHPALLAWAREGSGVQFDEALVKELFPGNEGHEILSTRHDLCLVLGELKRETAKIAAVASSAAESTLSAAERWVREVEAKFAHRIKLADYPEGTHIPGCECLETEHAGRALAAFREAEAKGISRTELYVSKGAIELISLIPQYHPVSGVIDSEMWQVQEALFRIYHLLQKHGSSDVILQEGCPYEEDFGGIFLRMRGKLKSVVVPGTSLQLLSPEGQQVLAENPGKFFALQEQISKSGDVTTANAILLLLPEWFPGVRGAEMPNMDELKERYNASLAVCTKLYRKYRSTHGPLGIAQNPLSRSAALSELKLALEARKEIARINDIRERFVASKAVDIAHDKMPHVVFGRSHIYPLLDRYAGKNVGVILTFPASLPEDFVDLDWQTADERDNLYVAVRKLVASLES
jgi:hypothetical protein